MLLFEYAFNVISCVGVKGVRVGASPLQMTCVHSFQFNPFNRLQIANDITQMTPASFEPSIDYVITKVPRFNFEKFAGSLPHLTTMMKSVGEVGVSVLSSLLSLRKLKH